MVCGLGSPRSAVALFWDYSTQKIPSARQCCHSGVGTASASHSVTQSEPSELHCFDCFGHSKVNVGVFLTYFLWVPLVIPIVACFRADSNSQIIDTTLQGLLEGISKPRHSNSTTLLE